MFTRLLPATLILAAVPALGQPACEMTGGGDSCSRVLACVGEDGLWFDGRAIGWNTGTVAGELSDGTVCTGEWAYTSSHTAETYVRCDDGMEVVVVTVSRDPSTATSIGKGTTSDGRSVMVWTGGNILQFLRGDGDEPALPCTPDPIPIS
jgi:hypothetical protein